MSELIHWYIIIIVAIVIGGCTWLLIWTRKDATNDPIKPHETMGHAFDGIEEYNNPLPRWWLFLFYGTIVFAIGYLILYPGLGHFQGVLGWTSAGAHEKEVQKAEEKYGPLFASYAKTPIVDLAKDTKAMEIGQRLFATNCSVCHGSDAKGAVGFPNLTDNDWLYGGEPEQIEQTILHGRQGNMPKGGLLQNPSEGDVNELAQYVLSLSGKTGLNPRLVKSGEALFQQGCAACHGADGKGSIAAGAPNLADNIWLFGGSANAIKNTIRYGRAGVMPAHKDLLGEDKVHILAAYIYSLSNK